MEDTVMVTPLRVSALCHTTAKLSARAERLPSRVQFRVLGGRYKGDLASKVEERNRRYHREPCEDRGAAR